MDSDQPWSVFVGGGGVNFTFIAWEPPLACLAWEMMITDGREVSFFVCLDCS